jgi:hypothetical protein
VHGTTPPKDPLEGVAPATALAVWGPREGGRERPPTGCIAFGSREGLGQWGACVGAYPAIKSEERDLKSAGLDVAAHLNGSNFSMFASPLFSTVFNMRPGMTRLVWRPFVHING